MKVQINNVDITNYSYMEDYLKKMAKKGWLLEKIKYGIIFIYKRIEPSEFDFHITPIKIENNRWNFVCKTTDFNIYYTEDIIEKIEPNMNYKLGIPEYISELEKNELPILERISEKRTKYNQLFFSIPLLLNIVVGFKIFTTREGLTTRIIQTFAFVLLSFIYFFLMDYLYAKRSKYIHENSGYVKSDLKELNHKRYRVFKIVGYLVLVIFLNFLLYDTMYNIFIAKNYKNLIYSIVAIIFTIIAYNYYNKGMENKTENRFAFDMVDKLVILMVIALGFVNYNLSLKSRITDFSKIENNYQYIVQNDFDKTIENNGGEIVLFNSYIFPKAYYFKSNDNPSIGLISMSTKNQLFFRRYKELLESDNKQNLKDKYLDTLKLIYNENNSEETIKEELEKINLNPKLYNSIREESYDKKIEETLESLYNINYSNANIALWEVDEMRYQNIEKTEAYIKMGKTFYYIKGVEMLGEDTIEVIKEKLNLTTDRIEYYFY